MARKQGQGKVVQIHRGIMAVAMGILLLVAIFASEALAEGDPGTDTSPGPLVTPSADSVEELNAIIGEGGGASGAITTTDPSAAEALPHSELNRSEAEELLVSVFPTATETPAGIFNDLEVDAFRSDYVAVVPADSSGEPDGLLTSLLPLRAVDSDGAKSAVDLSLTGTAQGALRPENPIVEVKIPAAADEAITLPESGVGIELVGSQSDPSPSVIDEDAAFYPNVAEDSDLFVAPTPTGFETFTQLRSAAAPMTHRFALSLPEGATLQPTSDGGAIVLKQGEPLVVVKPPTALDANGQAVPVSLTVDDRTVEVQATPASDTAYPILVDPLWENYSWKDTNSNAGIGTDWRSYTTPNQSLFTANWIGNLNPTLYSGLALRSLPGAITPGISANWNYYVPRYFTDAVHPTSFIRNMKLSQVYYLVEEAPTFGQPYLIAGIWDEKNAVFHSSINRYATEGAWNNVSIELPNSQENESVKNGGVALASFNSSSFKRQVYVGSASVEITDKDIPTWGYLPNPGVWTNNSSATAPFDYAVSDSGLGVSYVKVTRPQASGGSADVWTSYECAGSASDPCPATAETATRPITYDPGAMAQGESILSVRAQDPVGNLSAPKLVKVKVDHDKPTTELSGNLTEQGAVGTKLAKYTLNYIAADGDDAAAAAMTPVGSAGTGTGQLEHPYGLATDAAGNIWITDTVNNRVVELDKNGNYIRQISSANGVAFKELRGITVAPNGNLWVAEKGANRVMKFSSTGGFISQFTNVALQPFDVAVSEGGTVWITDPIDEKVFRFKEDGTLLQSIDKSSWYLPAGPQKPYGIDLDEFGNAWIAIQGTNAGLELSPTGGLKWSFATSGSGPGQLNAPFDVAVASSGNVFISDSGNNRIQEFKPDGTYLRTFGTGPGSANNQLNQPKGIDVAAGNKLLIADFENRRVARWEHADQDPQSGVTKVQIKVDGTVKLTNAPGCAAGKNCSLTGSWTLNADDYTVGSHKVEVLATDGVKFVTEKVLNIETHGDRTAPTVALSGSITEQASLGKTLPAYKLKVAATDPGPAEERKSGVASIVIKVDGVTVDSTAPGCPNEGCSLSREWTLKSNSKPAGWHWLEVITTDAAGKVQTSVREFELKPDTTAPVLALSGILAEAPEGWVQEGTRSLVTNATDVGGYGVKQIRFLIDGQVVGQSAPQMCEFGSCSKSQTFSIDMAQFGGGAHEGVAIAEDLAGNIHKKTWTINIDPLGNISVSEATDTLEAVEQTAPEIVERSPASAIVAAKASEGGLDPHLLESGGQILVEGIPMPITVGSSLGDGYALNTESMSEEGIAHQQNIEIAPTGAGTGGQSTEIVNKSAAVISNSGTSVDTILRPIYNGLMTFQDIRDTSAPETYSWEVKLGGEESLNLINSEHAGVFWDDGTEAMLISAQSAHGADGKPVATSLSVSGKILTLTVQHKAAGTLYPVTAGVGWLGGVITEEAKVTEPEPPLTYEAETSVFSDPPPEWYPAEASDPDGASASSTGKLLKKFGAHQCEKVPPFSPIKGCSVWEQTLKGFFWYNYGKAWATREPACPNDGSVAATPNNPSVCNWVGPKAQKYGGGYHITAQAIYDVSYVKIAETKEHHLSIYAYGSGYWNDHDTDCVCNPLPTD